MTTQEIEETGLIELPEYRPMWEIGGIVQEGEFTQIEHGWEVRTEDDRWVKVEAAFEFVSSDPDKDPVTQLHVDGDGEITMYSADLIMSRRVRT